MAVDKVMAIVLVPMSLLTGFSAASMSFTAWNLVCPLLFSVFGLPVFQALFVSVMLDVTNGFTLTLIYGTNGKVDFNYGIRFGLIALAWATLMAILLSEFIENNSDKLKSAVSFVPLLIAIQFFVRGMLAWKRQRAAEKEAAAAAASLADESSGLLTETMVSPTTAEGTASRRASIISMPRPILISKHDDLTSEPLSLPGPGLIVVSGGIKDNEPRHSVYGGDVERQTDEAHRLTQKAPTNGYSTIVTDSTSAMNIQGGLDDDFETDTVKGKVRSCLHKFKPDEDILGKPLTNRKWRITVTVIINTILGIVSGTLYAGGGMFFANVIVNFWSTKVRTAAGTGCFIMTMVMTAMSFTFIGRTGMNDIVNLYHLLLSLPFGCIGAILGARLALRISDLLMYFVIVGISLVLFTVILVNGIFGE